MTRRPQIGPQLAGSGSAPISVPMNTSLNMASTGSGTAPSIDHYRPDIDGLRAVAVLSVVFYHAFPKGVGGGYVGADVFFVISGFLISKILFTEIAEHRFSFAAFYGRRIRRKIG